MNAETIIAPVKREILRNTMGTFVDNPPSIAEGGQGVVVPGCAKCKTRLHMDEQFLDHLIFDVVPQAIRTEVE